MLHRCNTSACAVLAYPLKSRYGPIGRAPDPQLPRRAAARHGPPVARGQLAVSVRNDHAPGRSRWQGVLTVLSEKITSEAYSALHDVEKAHYKAASDGSGYDLQHDGVGKLKAALDDREKKLREKDAEAQRYRQIAESFSGLDPEEARKAKEQMEALERGELLKKGDLDTLLKKEAEKYAKTIADLKKSLDAEQAAVHGMVVSETTRRALTSGEGPDGSKVPAVKPEYLEAVEAMLLARYRPAVKADGEKRLAMAAVDGIERPWNEFLARDFLTSDAAKAFVAAPDSTGGHNPATKPGIRASSVPQPKQISAADTAAIAANFDKIASGEVVVV